MSAPNPDNPNTHADAYKNYVNTIFHVASQVTDIPRVGNSVVTNLANQVSATEYGQFVLYDAIGSVTKSEATSLVLSPVKECGMNCKNLAVGSQVNPVIQQIYGVPKH